MFWCFFEGETVKLSVLLRLNDGVDATGTAPDQGSDRARVQNLLTVTDRAPQCADGFPGSYTGTVSVVPAPDALTVSRVAWTNDQRPSFKPWNTLAGQNYASDVSDFRLTLQADVDTKPGRPRLERASRLTRNVYFYSLRLTYDG